MQGVFLLTLVFPCSHLLHKSMYYSKFAGNVQCRIHLVCRTLHNMDVGLAQARKILCVFLSKVQRLKVGPKTMLHCFLLVFPGPSKLPCNAFSTELLMGRKIRLKYPTTDNQNTLALFTKFLVMQPEVKELQ